MGIEDRFTPKDHVLFKDGAWWFLDQHCLPVGPYESEAVAIRKWREYQLYLDAH